MGFVLGALAVRMLGRTLSFWPSAHHSCNTYVLSNVKIFWLSREERSAHSHFTFSRGPSRSILDRVACSHSGIMQGSIDISPVYIPATDHRPISTTLFLSQAGLGNAVFARYPDSTYSQRYRYPLQNTQATLAAFAASVDDLVADLHLADSDVQDDASFTLLYNSLTHAFLSAADSNFQLPSAPNPSPRLRSQTIRLLVRETRRIGRLIFAAKTGPSAVAQLCARNPWAPPYLTAFQALPHHHCGPTPAQPTQQPLLHFLAQIRKTLNKLRYQAERTEAAALETRRATARINRVLLGGSSKILYPPLLTSSPPLALSDPTVSTQLLTGANEIKAATVSYFSTLYHHSDAPPPPKPWLSTPSVLSIHQHTLDDPFLWPQPLTLTSLRALLRKGNARPAPGPDRWEKWFIKALSDDALSLVLKLLNYEIIHSHFPDIVKPSTVSTIFKRGSRFDLSNYRGICCSNFLLSTPFTWLNHCLGPYISQHGLLPPGQIATQPGVQGHDLTSLFAQIETWANRHHVPLYALRRDQQKGFDRLSPQGFYDAVHAYGLPEQLIQLDISAQTNVPYSFKTAHGLTDPLIISGVTKQGGPLSPLKSTLTTSLGHHWLNDLALTDPGALVLSTHQARLSFPHIPPDHISLRTTMVEAMDDSTIFATSLPSLHTFTLAAERFQAAYGWLTSWPKSLLLLLNVPTPPPIIPIPSVDPDNMLSDQIIMRDVSVVTDHMEFLRVATNDPHRQFLRIRDIVDSFQFPLLHCHLPFTLLRRLVIQRLVSKIRPHLAFQPLLRSDAEQVDRLIAHKVHTYLQFPFPFNSQLLSMPFHLHGFDFPSISRLNDSAAVLGLIRDLNHHLPLFRDLASISLADWTCSLAHCHSPLHAASPAFHRSFARLSHKIPSSWVIAHSVLRNLSLSIHDTDLSYLLSGQVALQHLARTSEFPSTPSSHLIRQLTSAGFTQLSDIGSWSPGLLPTHFSFQPHADLPDLLHFTSALPSLPSLTAWLSSLSLSSLTYGSPSLALPPRTRQHLAEKDLLSLSKLLPLPSPSPISSLVASDASMSPSPASPLTFRSVTFASASPTASFCGSLSNFGRSATILHGELYGILLATLLSTSSSPTAPLPIYTDHLNSVNILNDAMLKPPPPHAWSSLPARSMYRWIYSILTSSQTPPTLHHIKAHTSAPDPPSRANDFVDRLASSSHSLPIPPPAVPLPTFTMDKFTPYLPSFNYIDSRLPLLLHSLLASQSFFRSSFTPFHITLPLLYDTHPPPLHPYTRASSSYSAVVQLYARSGQLPTNLSRATRFHDGSMLCRYGCQSVEDKHHIFVHCEHFHNLRHEYSTSLTTEIETSLTDSSLPTHISVHLLHVATHLFHDNSSWPLHSSRYYLGLLPSLLPPTQSHQPLSDEMQRLITRIAHSCHLHAIRLTARIWGTVVRQYLSSTMTSGTRGSAKRDNLLRTSKLTLPSHLHTLLPS